MQHSTQRVFKAVLRIPILSSHNMHEKKNVKTLIKIEILLNFTDIFTKLIFSKVVLDDYSLRNFKQTIYKSTKYNIIQLQI